MTKSPPDILVTTPESLYLLVTAERSRAVLNRSDSDRRRDPRPRARQAGESPGAHPRASRCASGRAPAPTGRPLRDSTAHRADGFASYRHGHRARRHDRRLRTPPRTRSCRWSFPESELGPVASTEQMGEVLDRIASLVQDHSTTLVFVNTRRLSERLAHELGERLGPDQVSAHHGSLSRQRREKVETRLSAGELRALVATASLELGIDIGPVELVCQVGSPRSIATFLQRVGRSNHSRSGVPEGVPFPTHPRRAGRVRGTARRGAGRAARHGQPSPRPARHPRPADHRRSCRSRANGTRTGCTSSSRRASPYGRARARGLRRRRRPRVRGDHDRQRAGGWRTCTATR